MTNGSSLFHNALSISCRGRLVDLFEPKVMGIINLTPDSFYGASRTPVSFVVDKAGDMLLQGAAFLDLGGYSSRPGATDISVQQETDRVVPAIEAVMKAFPDAIISVDTFRAEVAEASLVAGASIVNDISAGHLDNEMLKVVGRHQAPYVMMHMRGTPQNRQQFTYYDNLEREVLDYFSERIAVARAAGINDIILDPGFGFSKTVEQNFELLRSLKGFSAAGLPLLVGVSRKSMITKTLNISSQDTLNGTTALHALALNNGAQILRVHDVREAVEAVKIFQAYRG